MQNAKKWSFIQVFVIIFVCFNTGFLGAGLMHLTMHSPRGLFGLGAVVWMLLIAAFLYVVFVLATHTLSRGWQLFTLPFIWGCMALLDWAFASDSIRASLGSAMFTFLIVILTPAVLASLTLSVATTKKEAFNKDFDKQLYSLLD